MKYAQHACPGCGTPIHKRSKRCAECAGINLPENRDKHALCGARKKDGSTCRLYSGQGTDHPGVGSCKHHGGATESHNKAAREQIVKRQMIKLAEPLPEDITSHRVLFNLMRKAGGFVEWLEDEIHRLEDLGSADAAAKLSLFREWFLLTGQAGKWSSEAQVEAAEAALSQSQATLAARMVKEALTRAGIGGKAVEAVGVGLRVLALEAQGERVPEAEAARLDRLREEIADDDRRRVEREAQRQIGLIPPEDLAPGEDTGFLNPAA